MGNEKEVNTHAYLNFNLLLLLVICLADAAHAVVAFLVGVGASACFTQTSLTHCKTDAKKLAKLTHNFPEHDRNETCEDQSESDMMRSILIIEFDKI